MSLKGISIHSENDSQDNAIRIEVQGMYTIQSHGSLQWNPIAKMFTTVQNGLEGVWVHEAMVLVAHKPKRLTDLLSLGNYATLVDITLDHIGPSWIEFAQRFSPMATVCVSSPFSMDDMEFHDELLSGIVADHVHFRKHLPLCHAFRFCVNPFDYYLTFGRYLMELYQRVVNSTPPGQQIDEDNIFVRAWKVRYVASNSIYTML
jgi:hypothetical protein